MLVISDLKFKNFIFHILVDFLKKLFKVFSNSVQLWQLYLFLNYLWQFFKRSFQDKGYSKINFISGTCKIKHTTVSFSRQKIASVPMSAYVGTAYVGTDI